MNWVAQAASSSALLGEQGIRVARFGARFCASCSAAVSKFFASVVPMAPGVRKGKALLLVSSASFGTSPKASVESPSSSCTVFRYSRAVSLLSGNRPAAFGSAVLLEPAPLASFEAPAVATLTPVPAAPDSEPFAPPSTCPVQPDRLRDQAAARLPSMWAVLIQRFSCNLGEGGYVAKPCSSGAAERC